jgi:hypothetical protein
MKYLLNSDTLATVVASAKTLLEDGKTDIETKILVSPDTFSEVYKELVEFLPEDADPRLRVNLSIEIVPDPELSGPGAILEGI